MKPLYLSLAILALALGSGNMKAEISTPLQLTAMDMVTKAFGLLDPSMGEKEAVETMSREWNVTPQNDSTGWWMDASDGYSIDYYGMNPEVCAVANMGDSAIVNYTYFFLFPYTEECREEAVRNQSAFCGCLLQEMHDFGLLVGVPDSTDAIFECVGSYGGHHIDVRLTDDPKTGEEGGKGCFVVAVAVTPAVYNVNDYILAAN